MTDLLSIATYAADQIVANEDRNSNLELVVDFATTDYGWMVELVSLNRMDDIEAQEIAFYHEHGQDHPSELSATQQIIAEMRAENAAAMANHNARMIARDAASERGVIYPSPLRERTTVRLSPSQQAAKVLLLKGCAVDNRNTAMLLVRVSKRANGQMAYARRGGKQTPDMLASLMAYFATPSQLSHATLLAQVPPTAVPTAVVRSVLADEYVIDAIEGRGFTVPQGAAQRALVTSLAGGVSVLGRGAGRGRPRKVHTYTGALTGHTHTYASAAMPVGRGIPGHSPGHGYRGVGWAEAWAKGRKLTPDQAVRRDIALDAYHREAARMEAARLSEMSES